MPSGDNMIVGNDLRNGVVCMKVHCRHLPGETEVSMKAPIVIVGATAPITASHN